MVALNDHVLLGEMEAYLKFFKRDKILGLKGWTMEFYITFFELIGPSLLLVIEDCILSSRMYERLKLTFLALIPKADNPIYFDQYQPIPLCNYVYKIISTIIAIHLKPFLSKMIVGTGSPTINFRTEIPISCDVNVKSPQFMVAERVDIKFHKGIFPYFM